MDRSRMNESKWKRELVLLEDDGVECWADWVEQAFWDRQQEAWEREQWQARREEAIENWRRRTGR